MLVAGSLVRERSMLRLCLMAQILFPLMLRAEPARPGAAEAAPLRAVGMVAEVDLWAPVS
jgi:hypothetical protein